jgi:hypothetical protein
MPVRLRFRGLSRPLEAGSCLPKNFIDPKPPILQKGGFLFKIPKGGFRKINMGIDNRE